MLAGWERWGIKRRDSGCIGRCSNLGIASVHVHPLLRHLIICCQTEGGRRGERGRKMSETGGRKRDRRINV